MTVGVNGVNGGGGVVVGGGGDITNIHFIGSAVSGSDGREGGGGKSERVNQSQYEGRRNIGIDWFSPPGPERSMTSGICLTVRMPIEMRRNWELIFE